MVKKIIILVIILAVLFLAFYGIKSQLKPKAIVFGTSQKMSSVGFLAQIIKTYGIDKKHGLDIVFEYNEPGLSMTKLLNRQLDVGILAPISAAKANLEGKRVKIFGPIIWNVNSLVVPKESPYQTLEELKGKKLGILPQVTASYTNMDLIVRLKGWQLQSDFQLVIGGLEDQAKFLKNRDVDFAVIYEPLTSRLLASGEIREIATLDELLKQLTGERFAFVQIAAYEDWIKNHKREAKKLVETFSEVAKFVQENPQLFEKHKDLLGLQTGQEIEMVKKRMPRFYQSEWNQASVDNINTLIRKAVEVGQVSKMPEEPIVLILD